MIEKRTMGKTGEKASILGFGCMRLPQNGPKPSDIDHDLATKMLRSAIDAGVDYVDTAFSYHSSGDRNVPGASEPFLAHALKGGYREKVKLATKLPTWLVESLADMHKFLDMQLKSLDTHRIDYYLAHNLNRGVWEPMLKHKIREFFDEAEKDGRIRHPSFSFHDDFKLFKTILESYDWRMAQVQYNYLDTEFQAGREGVRLAAKRGAAVVVMEPMRGGFLVKYMPESQERVLKARRPDWSLAAWCLNWLWNQPEVSTVLSGMSDMAQTEDNLKTAAAYGSGTFDESDEEALSVVLEYFRSRMEFNCTACGYCLPCPSGVDIPKNLNFLNQRNFFDSREAKDRCGFFYGLLVSPSERASECVGCGECEEKCPQRIPIRTALEKTAATFAPA
ncbi:MAG: aldo/keto reductase [Deltaproteobacteria bacterium]|jgi:predicted aldo/keto reductase-like oxidoreductase|nr:aldo/keto reductase [Deltaproteobacteria bacterium]